MTHHLLWCQWKRQKNRSIDFNLMINNSYYWYRNIFHSKWKIISIFYSAKRNHKTIYFPEYSNNGPSQVAEVRQTIIENDINAEHRGSLKCNANTHSISIDPFPFHWFRILFKIEQFALLQCKWNSCAAIHQNHIQQEFIQSPKLNESINLRHDMFRLNANK